MDSAGNESVVNYRMEGKYAVIERVGSLFTLRDGQEALWQACADSVPDADRVEILDLLHVTPRLWQAAKLLYGEKGQEVLPFVRRRLTQVLEGKVEAVIRAARR